MILTNHTNDTHSLNLPLNYMYSNQRIFKSDKVKE